MQHQHVVMSTLMSGLRTGNPLADGLITSLLFAAMTFFMTHVGAWWMAFVEHLFAGTKATAKAVSRISVPMVLRTNTGAVNHSAAARDWMESENRDYQSLAWFMTTHVPVTTGTAIVTRNIYAQAPTVLPDRSQPLSHAFDGHTVKFTRMFDFVKKDDGSASVTNERIELSVDVDAGVPLLLRLLAAARQEHADSVKRIDWKQRLFRVSVVRSTRDNPSRHIKFVSSYTHSTKSFDTIVLDPDVKADLVDDVAAFLAGEAWYASMGLSYKRGYLLHGPPGTGKSSIILAIAGKAKADIYSVNLSVLKSDIDLDSVFAQIPDRCVVIFEDIDCMGSVVRARAACPPAAVTGTAKAAIAGGPAAADAADATDEAADDSGGVTLSCLLNHLDGAGSNHGRIFVMTSNHPELLDPALVRPGRADMHVRLDLCCLQQIGLFFELFYPGISPPARLLDIPGGALSPAEVSSTMLQFRRDATRAVETLAAAACGIRTAAGRREDPTYVCL